MLASAQQPYLTPDQYLRIEEHSNIKHEYIDGQVYAITGASDAHFTIAGNLFALLRSHVRGSGCRVYISDVKARIESLNRFYYPDVMVTCNPIDQETSTYKRFPTLIVEVLSDSTEAFDRGDKFVDYQEIESLREYVLISTKRQRTECFRRNEQGLWVLQSYRQKQTSFRFDSINFEGKKDIPMVKEQLPLIQEVQAEDWWTDVTLWMIDYIRIQLRDLIKFVDRQAQRPANSYRFGVNRVHAVCSARN